MSDEPNKRTKVDLVRDALLFVLVVLILLVWWFVMLLLGSLFLVNVWKVTMEQIIQIATVMTVISAIGYIIISTRKNAKKRWPK